MADNSVDRFFWLLLAIELLLALPAVLMVHINATELHRARLLREVESRLLQEPLKTVVLDSKYPNVSYFQSAWQRLSLDLIAPLLDTESEFSEEQYRLIIERMPPRNSWTFRLVEPIHKEIDHLHEILQRRKLVQNLDENNPEKAELLAALRLQEQQTRKQLEERIKESFLHLLVEVNRFRKNEVSGVIYSKTRPFLLSVGIDAPPLP